MGIKKYQVIDLLFKKGVGQQIEYSESCVMDWDELDAAVEHYKFVNRFVYPARI